MDLHNLRVRILSNITSISASFPSSMQTIRAIAMRLLRSPLGKRLLAAQPLSEDGEALLSWAGKIRDLRSESLAAMEYATLECTPRPSGVVDLQLKRAKKLNALNMQMWTELQDAFDRIEGDPHCRAVVLSGDGDHFSTGMDLRVFAQMSVLAEKESCPARTREMLRTFIGRFQDIVSKPEHCRVPVLAAVHGHCIGAAVDLVTSCDMRYCTKDANFSVKEIDLGIVADVGTLQRLPRVVGDQRCRELSFTGRAFSGAEAKEYGMVLEAFDSQSDLLQHVHSVAEEIASKSPMAVVGVKHALNYVKDHSTEDSLNQVATWNAAMLMGEDLDEAMAATMEKRTPRFRSYR